MKIPIGLNWENVFVSMKKKTKYEIESEDRIEMEMFFTLIFTKVQIRTPISSVCESVCAKEWERAKKKKPMW